MRHILRSLAPYIRGVCARGMLLAVMSSFLFWGSARGGDDPAPRVAVVVSRDIRPYVEAAEELNDFLTGAGSVAVEVFSLERFKNRGRGDLARRLAGDRFDNLLAIGPGAARFIWTEIETEQASRGFSMVLNPGKVLPPSPSGCGITLNIPVQEQLEAISRGLPGLRNLGLLYDPGHNRAFFERASLEASSLGLTIVPLTVSSKKEIPSALKESLDDVDALWLIPDRTVVSETIVRYVIKKALLEGVPLIGFNRFFYESGAALAFVFDYEELGRQTGRLVLDMLGGNPCEVKSPIFHLWLNLRVLEKLGLEVPEERAPPLEAGP